jgi:hypothetical protein
VSAGGNIRWESIALGWLVALPAGLLLGPPLRGAYDALTGASVTPGKLTPGLVIVSVVTGFLAYLFGGYVAGRFARRAGGLHGAMTAVLGVAAGAVLGAFGVAVSGGTRRPDGTRLRRGHGGGSFCSVPRLPVRRLRRRQTGRALATGHAAYEELERSRRTAPSCAFLTKALPHANRHRVRRC